jgi:hypothetical protein
VNFAGSRVDIGTATIALKWLAMSKEVIVATSTGERGKAKKLGGKGSKKMERILYFQDASLGYQV